ncbi:MAG: metal-sulfur cluster assembly factor [Rhodocyclaceae bacterium]
MSDAGGMPGEPDVREALRAVIDPEVGMNVVDLGLVYDIRIDDVGVEVDIAMTSPACPMGESITREAREALRSVVPATRDVRVRLVSDPPWSPARMSEAARRHFGW